ncbi:MAG: MFS transporter, partial [Acidobacteria bacterium]
MRPAPHVPEVPEAQGVATPPMSATPRRRARTGTGEDEALRGYWRLVGRHYRWNVGVNALQGATALFSMALFMPETVLTAYMTTLTDSKLLIGLPWALSLFYWSFSALFYTRKIESCRQRMGVTQALSAPTRLAFTLMAASAWVAGYGPVVAIVVFFIGEALLTLTGGGAAVSWQDLLGRVFPPSKRGWAFGMREGFGHLSGFCGTAFMLWYLKGRGHDPQSYMWPFTVGAIVYWLSLVALWMTREPRWPYEAPKLPPRRQYYADMFSVLRTNANFRTYVVVKCLIASTAIFNFGLFVPYAIEHFGVSQAFAAGVFSAIALAGRICAAPIAGRLADRKGLKVPLLTGLTLVAGLLCVGLSLEYFAA